MLVQPEKKAAAELDEDLTSLSTGSCLVTQHSETDPMLKEQRLQIVSKPQFQVVGALPSYPSWWGRDRAISRQISGEPEAAWC